MILRGGRVALEPGRAERMDIAIEDGRIRLNTSEAGGPELDCSGLMVLPGLINAHDHLEFNLFPRLGHGPYSNATEWARDVYRPDESPVREHRAVPREVRLRWGGLKNLLSGATTVMHHNPYEAVFDVEFPVVVVRRYRWAHSPVFSPDFARRFAEGPPEWPFLIHACEGIDACARDEVRVLERSGVLGAETVLVHGVALDKDGIAAMLRSGASLIWCPTSNAFSLGRSISDEVLSSGIPIALGTDSALTADGDLIDEMQAAAHRVGWERVYRMVTTDAARILRLGDGEGEVRDGGRADLLMIPDRSGDPVRALAEMRRPEYVFVGGRMMLSTREPLGSQVELEGRGPCGVDIDVHSLRAPTEEAIGPHIRLAAKRVAA